MKFATLIASAISLTILSGCGSTAPSCDAGEVKDSIKNQFITAINNEQAMTAILTGAVNGVLAKDPNKNYEQLQDLAKNDQQAANVLKEINEISKSIQFSFEDVRPDSLDDKAKKSICLASMKMSNKNNSEVKKIKYIAQQSSSGLIVEISKVD